MQRFSVISQELYQLSYIHRFCILREIKKFKLVNNTFIYNLSITESVISPYTVTLTVL